MCCLLWFNSLLCVFTFIWKNYPRIIVKFSLTSPLNILFIRDNKAWHFIWIVWQADSSHGKRIHVKLSNLISLKRKKKCVLPITKTCLYNFDPLKPEFYIVKLGFTGVYIIFLISAQKRRLWVPTMSVLSRNMKKIGIFIWKLSVFGGEIFNIFE